MTRRTDPDEDGQVLGMRRRVDVEIETVFVAEGRVEAVDGRHAVGSRLGTPGGLIYRRDEAVWGRGFGGFLGGLPSQVSDWRSGVSDAVVVSLGSFMSREGDDW